ncbi:MAG: hypothetical protein BIP78_1413 [Candidatus Bipolaricaulis sibiricus]|uniref:Lipopolysaccharide assembly protein A domain-containing protein n=1 Tax=Bipolaricaulis sibiricus TaxID=2501609 RepID=A0A410FVR7_BIPS1|nr:MAG: hypothetical protein BIP78_1413 [Candidatus Bipolaricaulis sibiricus]
MRYLYAALAILLTAAVLVFIGQNIGEVTVSYVTMRFTLPLSVLVVLAYVLGMFTGGSLSGLFRSLFRQAAQPKASEPPPAG